MNTPPPTPRPTLRILVIEDEAAIRALLVEVLKRCLGHEHDLTIEQCVTTAEGSRKIGQPWDVIFSDRQTPAFEGGPPTQPIGPELLRRFREDAHCRHAVLILHASAIPVNERLLLQAINARMIEKPANVSKIMDVVRSSVMSNVTSGI